MFWSDPEIRVLGSDPDPDIQVFWSNLDTNTKSKYPVFWLDPVIWVFWSDPVTIVFWLDPDIRMFLFSKKKNEHMLWPKKM